jgi:hypothetical protein
VSRCRHRHRQQRPAAAVAAGAVAAERGLERPLAQAHVLGRAQAPRVGLRREVPPVVLPEVPPLELQEARVAAEARRELAEPEAGVVEAEAVLAVLPPFPPRLLRL